LRQNKKPKNITKPLLTMAPEEPTVCRKKQIKNIFSAVGAACFDQHIVLLLLEQKVTVTLCHYGVSGVENRP